MAKPKPAITLPKRSNGVAGAIGAAPGAGERPLFLDEVHARLPVRPDGAPRFSRKWARTHVAPDGKRYAGRLVYWLERDVDAWLVGYFGSAERRRAA